VTDSTLTSWQCSSCKEEFLDPVVEVPYDKKCNSCKEEKLEMKTRTSTGVEPAKGIKDVLAREEVKNLSEAEKVEYLKMLGFSLDEINKTLGVSES
jgi:hypothetical protein